MTRPLIVVEASERAVASVGGELELAGARIVRGWRHDASVVCIGTVRDAEDAAEALLAAVAGAGLVVHALAEREVIDRLVDDLRHLGRVDHRISEPDVGPDLMDEECTLLQLLADGLTLGAAAEHLHISRRTADRRLASARAKLGVETTAEAVVAFAGSRSGTRADGRRSSAR